ncbi:hypothetical protein ACLN6N_01770 [Sphingomonas carotinifaciens]|uniref:hypothetical protein n=1 Tax=Sphingomonas carotinifaciens TaxID=1166323 RepID=UPI0039A057F8
MGPDKSGTPADRSVFDTADLDQPAAGDTTAGAEIGFPDNDDEDGVELSLEDEDVVRTAFASALAEAIGDKGLIDAPSRSRQDRAQLVEVMQTDFHGREIEELQFIAMSFGLAASIELDPMMPEGHAGRVAVSLLPTGRSYV